MPGSPPTSIIPFEFFQQCVAIDIGIALGDREEAPDYVLRAGIWIFAGHQKGFEIPTGDPVRPPDPRRRELLVVNETVNRGGGPAKIFGGLAGRQGIVHW